MIRALFVAVAALAGGGAGAFEKLGVVAVADPPSGPDADLAELAHQIRAACRDRIGGVEDVPTMRARLLGQTSNATLSELDRAYGGALAVFQNGEFESALRTLHAIVEDLESLPETEDSYSQWVRAQLRLAHAALTIARDSEAEAAFYALAKTQIGIAPDPEQYSPSYRRRFEGIKAKVRALPARRLTVTSEGTPGTVFVNGRTMGTTPLALWLPAGTYRIGGQAGDLRVPSFGIDLRAEDRGIVLDFSLAESLRVNAGPGLALPQARRGDGIVRAGAWLIVDKVIAVSRVFEGEAAFLLGSMYDVRRGALLREGSVRMVAGSVPAANLGALAAFLLTGQSSRDVKDRTGPARALAAPIPLSAAPAPASEAPPSPVAASASPPLPPPVLAPPRDAAVPPVVESRAAAAPSSAEAQPTATAPTAKAKPGPRVAASAAAPANARVAASAAPPAPKAAPPPQPPAVAVLAAPAPPPTTTPPLGVLPPAGSPERGASPEAPRRWMRPAAIGSGIAAGAFAALAIQQVFASRSAYSDADAMVGPGGTLVPGSDPARYRSLRSDGDAAKRNAYVSAGAAVAFAAAAGVLGWRSMGRPAEPALAFRF
ncbi:MAG TPA: hypothetical protein VIW03_00220 [Anaeromyxobacter sp.]